jgi:hypothetical protein
LFGSEAWAHIPDEKMKLVWPKSEECIFVWNSKDVKGYIILQPYLNEINIIPSFKPNLMFMSSSTYEPYPILMPYSIPNFSSSAPILVSSSDDENEDLNPPLPTHLPLFESIEHEPTPEPQLTRWVFTTREEVGYLFDDPSYQRCTCSLFQIASFIWYQLSKTHYLETFVEYFCNIYWDATMNK